MEMLCPPARARRLEFTTLTSARAREVVARAAKVESGSPPYRHHYHRHRHINTTSPRRGGYSASASTFDIGGIPPRRSRLGFGAGWDARGRETGTRSAAAVVAGQYLSGRFS